MNSPCIPCLPPEEEWALLAKESPWTRECSAWRGGMGLRDVAGHQQCPTTALCDLLVGRDFHISLSVKASPHLLFPDVQQTPSGTWLRFWSIIR